MPFKIILTLSVLTHLVVQAQPAPTYSWTNLPKIAQPTFRKDTLNILTYGAKPDGITLNTKAINTAILACSQKGVALYLCRAVCG
ncbi:hypothetical protein [Spirosoma telluris]|uniref:hypothetical protein n=1 Tax=Spirosoma telluris TaxID=2183553 RepID=UPI002FC3A2D0